MRLTALTLLVPLVTGFPSKSSRASVPRDAGTSYDGYHIYSITPSSPHEYRDLVNRFSRYHTHSTRDTLSIAIPPSEIADFESLALDKRLVNTDLGAYIRSLDGKPSSYNRALHKRGELPSLDWFDTYHPYADHLDYWDDLVQAFPENLEKFSLGKSYENRTMWAFHLFGDKGKGGYETSKEKPVILWHATVHAREWISTMVIEYLTYQLIDGYKSSNTTVSAFLDHYDFYLVPFHNPDGFVYTQTSDRLWRKNRQPRPEANTTCIGTDGNRNWKFEWDAEPEEGGSTPDPCGQTYRGEAPGDTPENAALDALSTRLATQGIRSFIDFHSYGQLVLTPWGFSCDPLPETIERMVYVANGTARAIEAASERESVYEAGPGCQILYFSTGNSRDHHHGAHGANHSWTLELSPQEAREGGFVLPPEQIWPVVREQWAGQVWTLTEVWDG